MDDRPIKFYQTGTFTVGNRLLAEDQRSVQADMRRTNSLNSGHRACQGCGEALGARYAIDAAMRATSNQLIAVNATGCLEVFSTPYPETSWQIPWIHSLFGNAAAVASGVAAAQRALGRDDVRVIAQGGDGGTTDIGFGCLSGMFERNDDVLYICYDNEAYMNTGVQRSSATPPAARTATTPAVGPVARQRVRHRQERAAHRDGASHSRTSRPRVSPTCATSKRKVTRAMAIRGARYIHIFVPCPLGWGSAPRGHDPDRAARGRVAGSFRSSRPQHGKVTARTPIRRKVPVTEYLKLPEALRPPVRQAARRRAHRADPGDGRPATSPTTALLEVGQRPWTSLSPSRSTPARASPTRPAPGAPTARCTSIACRPATTPAPRARTSRAGSIHAESGDYEAAWRVLTEDNPLPAIMGRVCYHPCETQCNRGQLDEAVGINSVERFLGDEALKRGWNFAPRRSRNAASACWSSARDPRDFPPPITCGASGTR